MDHGKWLLGNGFRQQIKQNESDMEQEIESQLDVDNHDDVWRATAEVLRAQVSEAVWFSTFNDAVAVADKNCDHRRLLLLNMITVYLSFAAVVAEISLN